MKCSASFAGADKAKLVCLWNPPSALNHMKPVELGQIFSLSQVFNEHIVQFHD